MTNGRLAELNGGYVLLYESDFGFCIRGRDIVMRPSMEGVSGVFLQRDHNGLPLEPGQSNAVHEAALVGHVRAREARVMPEAYALPQAQAAALAYGIELVWPVLECTRIYNEQLAEVARREKSDALHERLVEAHKEAQDPDSPMRIAYDMAKGVEVEPERLMRSVAKSVAKSVTGKKKR